MAIKLSEIMEELPKKRREKIEARAAELITEHMTLRDLRKARELTQERMAELLGIRQDSVCDISRR